MINEELEKLKEHNPNIELIFKDDSKLMNYIGKTLFFNKAFMTDFVTTIGDKIYIPREGFDKWPEHAISGVIAHEFVHIQDSNKDKLFKLKYLFPQLLAPLMLLLFFVNWWLPLISFIACLAPWPAYWRKKYEVRGYIMSLVAMQAWHGDLSDEKWEKTIHIMNTYFTGPAYYFMWPFGVKKELREAVKKIKSGDIFKEDSIYQIGYDAVKHSKNYQIYENSV